MENKEKNLIMKRKIKEKGITLIALVITIIVILILSVVTINYLSSKGFFNRVNESTFKIRMKQHQEALYLYINNKYADAYSSNQDIDTSSINAGTSLKSAIEEEIVMDVDESDVSDNLKEFIGDTTKAEEEYLIVYGGELNYVSDTNRANNDKYVKWCNDIGINIFEYTRPAGIQIRNGSYELVKGIYMCTPEVNKGFNKTRTRYLDVNSSGYLVPGRWINKNPNENWYDYGSAYGSKWANILVENGGQSIYYTWIPRYCYKLITNTQRTDVKFIDINNNYKDSNGNVTSWDELSKEGYQVPEAFKFGDTELNGFWSMKYTAGDTTSSPITFNVSASETQAVIKNISVKDATNIKEYVIGINGNIVKRVKDVSQPIIIDKYIKAGKNIVNVTSVNSNGEVIGSMTKDVMPAIVNKPDLSGFNPDTTFYVQYDDKDVETSVIPIREKMPSGWYSYANSRWANIVTRNNGLETYYTWIPRYEYYLDTQNQRAEINFIQGTGGAQTTGYQVPEAFKFGDQALTGYWAMKYTAGDAAAPKFDSEMVATNNSIRTKGIIGTGKANGQKYRYYINGSYKGEETDSSKAFEFSGLNANTLYTILIEVRNSSNNSYIGSICKQIKTVDANKPELIGFNADQTYYVLYDKDGNETIGDKVKNDGSNIPKNWYNYSQSKWANIVVTDGTVSGGKITNATKTTYFVWIPRYEYFIPSTQTAQIASGRIDVRFLSGTSTDADTGYQIPEAFTFDGKALTGYWSMKYTVGE